MKINDVISDTAIIAYKRTQDYDIDKYLWKDISFSIRGWSLIKINNSHSLVFITGADDCPYEGYIDLSYILVDLFIFEKDIMEISPQSITYDVINYLNNTNTNPTNTTQNNSGDGGFVEGALLGSLLF